MKTAEARIGTSNGLMDWVSRFGVPLALVFAVIGFTLQRPGFMRPRNLIEIADEMAILALVAAGLTVCLAAGKYDLSFASQVTLASTLVVGLQVRNELPLVLALLITLLAGLLLGVVNGVLVGYLRMNALVTTLASGSILVGIQLWYSGGRVIIGHLPVAFKDIANAYLLGIPMPVWIMLGIYAATHLFLRHTIIGKHLRAFGARPQAARMTGLRDQRLVVLAFVATALGATLGGIVLSSRVGSAVPQAGNTYLLTAYAACFLGSVTIKKQTFHAVGTLIGAALIAVLQNGFIQTNADIYVQQLVMGGSLIVAVALTSWHMSKHSFSLRSRGT